jgi:hypothetical protein
MFTHNGSSFFTHPKQQVPKLGEANFENGDKMCSLFVKLCRDTKGKKSMTISNIFHFFRCEHLLRVDGASKSHSQKIDVFYFGNDTL